MLRIYDSTLDNLTVRRVDGLSYRMRRIAHGAEYNFSISTPADGAVPYVWQYKAPPLPTPANFRIASNDSGMYTFTWDPQDLPDET